jgi:hypothetical protein
MRILLDDRVLDDRVLDECVNPRLRLAFPGDAVKTVAEMGWRSLTNGRLIEQAAADFEVFVTLD